MKRLYIVVEGQTEREFVNSMIAPYLCGMGLFSVVPVLIRTSKTGRGGFVAYEHLKRDVRNLLNSNNNDLVVSMFVDFFRIPEVPGKACWSSLPNHLLQVEEMEKCINDDIDDKRFIPYIQLHEFEALLFSSNIGFESWFTSEEAMQTNVIVESFNNPEDINTTLDGAPSKRLLAIKSSYQKVLEGNLIALEIGMDTILQKCPRFKAWINHLVVACCD